MPTPPQPPTLSPAPTSAATTSSTPTPPVGPALSIRELSFTYRRNGGGGGGGDADRDEPYTLTIPALDLQPGQQMLITGSSGCGKSTLLSLIAGLLEAKHGRIAVAGTDMVTLRGAARDAHRGRHIGMIFQTFHLVGGMSSIENVELALMFSTLPPGEHRQRARYLLDRLGLTASNADRFVERLSVGQQQRVAIARAVACKPALVLADEPTAALDPDNARAAMDLIQTCCREAGAALLCVSHDTSIAERFLYRSTLADLVAGRGAGGHIAK